MRSGNLRNSECALFAVRRTITRAEKTDVLKSSRGVAHSGATNSHIKLPARVCSSTTILKEERRPTYKSASGFNAGCLRTASRGDVPSVQRWHSTGSFVTRSQALVTGYTNHQKRSLHVGGVQSRTSGALRMIATRTIVCPSYTF